MLHVVASLVLAASSWAVLSAACRAVAAASCWIGSANAASITRLICAVLLERNDAWQQHRYMQAEAMARLAPCNWTPPGLAPSGSSSFT